MGGCYFFRELQIKSADVNGTHQRFESDEDYRDTFSKSWIYIYCGVVVFAFNPYNELSIYRNDTIWTYRSQAMIWNLIYRLEGHDQSIIVSGELAVGKTILYFAILNKLLAH
uniref:Myosin motor domain-containing protein n=1 Tax=Vespula pensylvanica TaxID=30213 RepID=A0A834JT26_VESPE|nr:hypothetical protein H0235_017458 [Vespula pensylvanica]